LPVSEDEKSSDEGEAEELQMVEEKVVTKKAKKESNMEVAAVEGSNVFGQAMEETMA
jgi:hypothetical protein